LRTQSTTQDDLTFLPLRVTRVGASGKQSLDRADKQRLINACLQPGASLSGLALKAGVNANQLRKWVQLREQSNAPVKDGMLVTSSAFVPVVAIDDPAPALSQAPAPWPMPEPKRSPLSPRAGFNGGRPSEQSLRQKIISSSSLVSSSSTSVVNHVPSCRFDDRKLNGDRIKSLRGRVRGTNRAL